MKLKNFNKILITGARGNSAYFFLKKLEKKKIDSKIYLISRSKDKNDYFKQFNLNLHIFNGDINDEIFFGNCLKKIDTVLHLANMENSEIVTKVAAKKVKWLILVHSTMIYSKYPSKFINNRLRIDKKIKKKYNNVTILRPTMIYGRNDINISKLISFMQKFKYFPVFGNGENLMQPIYVEDLAESYFKVIINKSKTFNKSYNLPGKEPISYMNLLKTVEKKLNKKIYFFKIPIGLSIIFIRFFQIIFLNILPINASQIKRLSEDKVFSFKDARKDFLFDPMNFEDGIKKHFKKFLN